MTSGFLFADILIIDPSAEFVAEVRGVLQSAGYVVRRVAEGRAALDAIRQRPPDLVLLASALPDMDAYEVTRQIKREAALPFVPVIMLSERDRPEDISAALNAGADEFLQKPVARAELLVRARAMLRLKRTTDELRTLNATLEQKVAERTAELEEAHHKLRHAEKLSALGRLAASVAHDINNPLSGILSYLYLLKDDLPDDLAIQEDLALIERQVGVISSLVKKLQNFSKPPRVERAPVAVDEVIGDVLALTGKDLEKRKIEVAFDAQAPLPTVLAAYDQLSEVFMNLVVNARDAMPEGGKLTVCAHPENGHVVAQVSDTGHGIPPEVRERLFEPFFTTKGEQGTGLGLAICYRIVQEHGGDLAVTSEVGQGTTFTVRLPRA